MKEQKLRKAGLLRPKPKISQKDRLVQGFLRKVIGKDKAKRLSRNKGNPEDGEQNDDDDEE